MADAAQPYTKDDKMRPADEGRSLHDDVNRFARVFLGVDTPIPTDARPPKAAEFETAMRKVVTNEGDQDAEELDFGKRLIRDLQATFCEDLFDGATPDASIIGCAWAGAYKLSGGNPLKPKKKSSKKGGRQKGSKTWKESELDSLCDCIEAAIDEEGGASGSEMWDNIVAENYKLGKEKGFHWYRKGKDARKKFESLAAMEKPTGSNLPPVLIERCMALHEQIEQAEVMGYSAHNNALDDVEMDVTGNGLDGTRLAETSDDGSTSTMKSPSNRRKKKLQINEQLSYLTETLRDGNKDLASAVDRLVDKIGDDPANDGNNINGRTTALEADISDVKRDISELKTSVSNINSNMQALLSILQGRPVDSANSAPVDDGADAQGAPPAVTPNQSTKKRKSPPPPREKSSRIKTPNAKYAE